MPKKYYEDYAVTDVFNVLPSYDLPSVPQRIILNNKMTKREQQEINRIKSLIKAYFDIVKKNICDSVPKTIITFLVKNSISRC